MICPTGVADYFLSEDWTGQITLKSFRKLLSRRIEKSIAKLGREPINLPDGQLIESPLFPDNDQIPQRNEMTRCANKRHTPLKLPRNLVSTCRTFGGLHVGAAVFSS
jgi:hypothetical protein